MAQDIFYIEIDQAEKTSIFAFTRSETGILDYAGDVSKEYEGGVCKTYNDPKKMQRIESSLYFSPTWYTYLHKDFAANISVFIPKNIHKRCPLALLTVFFLAFDYIKFDLTDSFRFA